VVKLGATNDTDAHSRTALFDHHRQTEVPDRRGGKGLGFGSGKRGGDRQTGSDKAFDGPPVVAADADGVGCIGRRRTSVYECLEDRQQTFGSPVADTREDRFRQRVDAVVVQG